MQQALVWMFSQEYLVVPSEKYVAPQYEQFAGKSISTVGSDSEKKGAQAGPCLRSGTHLQLELPPSPLIKSTTVIKDTIMHDYKSHP
jgi:hypothetical protein